MRATGRRQHHIWLMEHLRSSTERISSPIPAAAGIGLRGPHYRDIVDQKPSIGWLEAQAAGLPVVAMNVAGVPEAVEHDVTGLLTPADDPAAFAGAIERLLTDRVELKRMGQMARQMILAERSLDQAATILDEILMQWTRPKG